MKPLSQDTDALLVIDVQNDFCPGGSLAIDEGDLVVPVVNRLAEAFDHVILTQDWHPPGHSSFASRHAGKQPHDIIDAPYGAQILWPDHCVQDTPGAAFHDGLVIPRAELILRKGFRPHIDSYSAFFENDKKTPTGLRGYLAERGFKRLFLVGLAYDVCVRFSAEDAASAGFEALVIEDACRSVALPGMVEATQASFADRGVDRIVSDTVR